MCVFSLVLLVHVFPSGLRPYVFPSEDVRFSPRVTAAPVVQEIESGKCHPGTISRRFFGAAHVRAILEHTPTRACITAPALPNRAIINTPTP